MSFTNPVKVPVKVYLSTDKDAPRLDRTPNCVQTIFKACLVTGFGDKTPAGWSLPFEDTTKGVKVFKPADSPHNPFVLRMADDTGREAAVAVYRTMSDIDTGVDAMVLSTPFKYGIQNRTTDKWALIATDRTVWFVHETANNITNSGAFFLCGDTSTNTIGERATILHYTGGTWSLSDPDRGSIKSNPNGGAIELALRYHTTTYTRYVSCFDGISNQSTNALLSPLLILSNNEVVAIPVYMPSHIKFSNYQIVDSGGRRFLAHATGTRYDNFTLVPIDYWEY